MKLNTVISKLFERSEELFTSRNKLVRIIEAAGLEEEQYNLSLLVKDLDLVRLIILHEYELLDTSSVVREDYVSVYYARRLEILQLSRQQLSRHYEVVKGICGHVNHKEALCEIQEAGKIIQASLRLFDRVIVLLEEDMIVEAKDLIKH